jgi:hypothetical protein
MMRSTMTTVTVDAENRRIGPTSRRDVAVFAPFSSNEATG